MYKSFRISISTLLRITTGSSWNISPEKTICLPPKGRLFCIIVRIIQSIASTMSQRTIEASSTMMVSTLRRMRCLVSLILKLLSFVRISVGIPKNEWMVSPPATIAAIPVGATMMKFLATDSRILRKKVVLPVPARPVKKKLALVLAIKSYAIFCGSLAESKGRFELGVDMMLRLKWMEF